MNKNRKILVIVAAALVVCLLVVLLVLLFRKAGGGKPPPATSPVPHSESAPGPPSSESPPEISTSGSGSIPYVGPIDSPLLGKWEHDYSGLTAEQLEDYPIRAQYEFLADGTCHLITHAPEDKEYPENWNTKAYTYRFDTYRGEDVAYIPPIGGDNPVYYEFFTTDAGREAVRFRYEQPTDGGPAEIEVVILRLEA